MDEILMTAEERYSPENIMRYRTAVAVAEHLEKEGYIIPCDARKIITALSRKYGFNSGSIFAA